MKKMNNRSALEYKAGQTVINQEFIEICDRELDSLLESAVAKICNGWKECRVLGLTGPTCSGKTTAAKKLIRQGRFNISQISDLLGFESPQYFSRCFKKFVRMTPREYQQSIQQ